MSKLLRDLPIAHKLVAIVMVTSLLVLLLASTALVVYDQVTYRRAMASDVWMIAGIIASNVSAPMLFGDESSTTEILAALSARPDVTAAAVYDADGRALSTYATDEDGVVLPAELPEFRGHRFDGRRLTAWRDATLEGAVVATVYVETDLGALVARRRQFVHTLGLVLIGTALASWWLASRLQSFVSVPVQRLSEAARRISEEKDYGVRVETYGKDELGVLTETFNTMLGQIQQRDRALSEAQSDLERRVEDRTRELREEIAARKQTQEALRSSEEQLRQSQRMEAVGRLAGGVAHDFNNLLTAITGYSDLLLAQLDPSDRHYKAAREIRRAGERAAKLTCQLLAFGRRQVLDPKIVVLNDVVAETEEMLRRTIGEHIQLVTRTDPRLGRAKADPNQLKQVLIHLAVNARDAMPDGGKLVVETHNVEVGAAEVDAHVGAPPGPYVQLTVTDTGHGMDEHTCELVFEPFFTTKDKSKGSGLGLSTVYGIVTQSGGRIGVDSEPGRGSTFRVYLPRVEEAAGSRLARDPVRSLDGTETVLLVEDEECVRELTRDILELRGYHVLEAPHGLEAIEICKQHAAAIDLMVTDVVMPHLNGPELYAKVSELRPGLPVLYMSGYTDNAIVDTGELGAGSSFIQKPFSPGSLARKVREVILDA